MLACELALAYGINPLSKSDLAMKCRCASLCSPCQQISGLISLQESGLYRIFHNNRHLGATLTTFTLPINEISEMQIQHGHDGP